jgi:uncharacterized protein (DUF58 family)
MIVPRNRLLFWFAVVAVPFALLAAVEPVAVPISVACIVALVAIALADALGARASLAGLSVELPAVVRMSKDREAKLEVRIRNERQKEKLLRLALGLPREIQSPDDSLQVLLPRDSEWSRLSWPCQAGKRGNFQLAKAYLEASSPLGFWNVRSTVPARSEVRVYPNLLTERKSLAALFLNRGTFGLHAQRQVGKGREFEKLREYIPGDSYDEVHWKATAKRGHPVTKVFQIERTQEVYVIIDASRLSARTVPSSEFRVPSWQAPAPEKLGTRNSELGTRFAELGTSTTLERFITAALVVGLAAEQQGDLFGLLTFTNRVESFVRARNGQAHFSACRDAIYTLQPQVVTPDFDELSTFIRLKLRRRALLIFLTSLDDPLLADSFVRNMDLICRQHLILVNMMRPAGAAPMFSNPNVASLDDLYRHLGGHLLWHKLRELDKILQRRGVGFALLDNESLSVQLVTQYLSVKRRQLL